MINPMDLTGKLIVVTGASSGLGRQTCITISRLGAKVILISRNEEKLKETLSMMEGTGHSVYPFDVTNIEGIEDLVTKIVADNGKIDGFVHSAGIGIVKPLVQTKYRLMLEMMQISLFSFVEFCRMIGKKKFGNDGASLVGISSGGAIRANKAKTAYCTAKGAMITAVRPLAVELGELRGMRANVVCPGWVRTDMYYTFIKLFGEDKMQEQLSHYPLGASEPVDVANTIAFLLSDASNKMTGQAIVIDGGRSVCE